MVDRKVGYKVEDLKKCLADLQQALDIMDKVHAFSKRRLNEAVFQLVPTLGESVEKRPGQGIIAGEVSYVQNASACLLIYAIYEGTIKDLIQIFFHVLPCLVRVKSFEVSDYIQIIVYSEVTKARAKKCSVKIWGPGTLSIDSDQSNFGFGVSGKTKRGKLPDLHVKKLDLLSKIFPDLNLFGMDDRDLIDDVDPAVLEVLDVLAGTDKLAFGPERIDHSAFLGGALNQNSLYLFAELIGVKLDGFDLSRLQQFFHLRNIVAHTPNRSKALISEEDIDLWRKSVSHLIDVFEDCIRAYIDGASRDFLIALNEASVN